MTRRALLRTGRDLGFAAGLVALTGSLSSCSGGAKSQRIAPLSSDDVGGSYGIQIHSSFRDSVYSNYDEVTALLQDLGARSVRDRLVTNVPESIEYLEHLGDLGITTLLTISEDSRYPTHREDPEQVISRMADHLDALAGDNEPNGKGHPPDWVAQTVELQQWIWNVGQDLGLNVCSPSLKQAAPTLEDDYAALSAEDFGTLCDVIAIHNYPRGHSPSEGIDEFSSLARGALGGEKPVYCTEGGYFTAPNYSGGAMPMSEEAQALYAPRQLLEYVRRGMCFWQYELMDDPDPTGTDREAFFGIVATPSLDPASWRRKPAFDTMKDLLAKTADPGPAFKPKSLSIKVEGPDDLENIVLGKRDGSYQIVAWRDVDVYDAAAQTPIEVEPEKVTVSVEGGKDQSFEVAGAAVVVPLST